MTVLPKENWVTTLLADNKLTTAINNATAIGEEGESYSNLHRLFLLLNSWKCIAYVYGITEYTEQIAGIIIWKSGGIKKTYPVPTNGTPNP